MLEYIGLARIIESGGELLVTVFWIFSLSPLRDGGWVSRAAVEYAAL